MHMSQDSAMTKPTGPLTPLYGHGHMTFHKADYTPTLGVDLFNRWMQNKCVLFYLNLGNVLANEIRYYVSNVFFQWLQSLISPLIATNLTMWNGPSNLKWFRSPLHTLIDVNTGFCLVGFTNQLLLCQLKTTPQTILFQRNDERYVFSWLWFHQHNPNQKIWSWWHLRTSFSPLL